MNIANGDHHIGQRPLALGLTLSGILLRLIPHLPNFAPVGGVSLFAGARLPGWQAYCVPLLVMAVTDPIMGFILGYPAFTLVTLFVYGSFLVNVWIGSHLRKTESPWKIGGAVVLASLQFFTITNLGMWAVAFPATLSGLSACYVAALPYLARTLVSNVLYAGLLFGLHAWLSQRVSPRERVVNRQEVVVT